MKRFTLVDNLFIHPTPGGIYQAFANDSRSPAQQLIRSLLSVDTTPLLTLEGLKQWSEIDDDDQALALLHHAQEVRWVQGFQAPLRCPEGTLEEVVPELLGVLGSQGKVLLADSQGFYLASSGFNHEVAEELSALSADLANLHERRSGLLIT